MSTTSTGGRTVCDECREPIASTDFYPESATLRHRPCGHSGMSLWIPDNDPDQQETPNEQ